MSAEQKPFVQIDDLLRDGMDWDSLGKSISAYHRTKCKKFRRETGRSYEIDKSMIEISNTYDFFRLYVDQLVDTAVLDESTLGAVISTVSNRGEGGREFAKALVLYYLCNANGMTLFTYRDVLDRAHVRRVLSRMRYEGTLPEQPDESLLAKARSIKAIARQDEPCDLLMNALILRSNLMRMEVPEKLVRGDPRRAEIFALQLKEGRTHSKELLRAMTTANGDIKNLSAQIAMWREGYKNLHSLLERIVAYCKSIFGNTHSLLSIRSSFFKPKDDRAYEAFAGSQEPLRAS